MTRKDAATPSPWPAPTPCGHGVTDGRLVTANYDQQFTLLPLIWIALPDSWFWSADNIQQGATLHLLPMAVVPRPAGETGMANAIVDGDFATVKRLVASGEASPTDKMTEEHDFPKARCFPALDNYVSWTPKNATHFRFPNVTPLTLAVCFGRLKIARWLAAIGKDQRNPAGAGPEEPAWNELMRRSITYGQLEIVRWIVSVDPLIAGRYVPGDRYLPPLLQAVRENQLEVAHWLATNGGGSSELHGTYVGVGIELAATMSRVAVVKCLATLVPSPLVDRPARQMIFESNEGRSPLLLAARSGSLELVRWFAETDIGRAWAFGDSTAP